MKTTTSLTLIFIGCLVSALLHAQQDLTPTWLVKPGSTINGGTVTVTDIATASDGSLYAAGIFTNTADFDIGADTFNLSSYYSDAAFIARYDKKGKLLFAKKIGGDYNYQDRISAIATDIAGNLYITGRFTGSVDFDPGPGATIASTQDFYDADLFFAKYDSSGNLIFVKILSGRNDTDYVNDIALDKNSNIYITGRFNGDRTDFDPGAGVANLSGNNKGDVFFAKYTPNGDYIFAKSMTGADLDEPSALTVDRNNNIFITGYQTSYNVDFDPGPATAYQYTSGRVDLFFAKYDSLGNYIYAHCIGGLGNEYSNSITTDKDDNVLITGQFSGINTDFDPGAGTAFKSSNGNSDIFFAKYSNDGLYMFVQTIGGTNGDNGEDIVTDKAGNIYITGTFAASDVDFGAGSGIHTLSSKGKNDIFFAKYSTEGNYIYTNQIGGREDESAHKLQVMNNGALFITGTFNGTIDADPGIGIYNISANVTNSFINAYAADGSLINAGYVGSYRSFGLISGITASTEDAEGNYYITGTFEGRYDFDPGPGTYYLTSTYDAAPRYPSGNRFDLFFAKYDRNGAFVFANNLTSGYDGTSPNNITVDADQNVYLCGYFTDSCDFDPGPGKALLIPDNRGDQTCFFAKYSAEGAYVLAKKIDGPYSGSVVINGIAVDDNKNIYINGSFSNTIDFDPGAGTAEVQAIGSSDFYFARYNADGNYRYVQHIGKAGTFLYHSSYDMKISHSGNLVLCGNFKGTDVDFNPGPGIYLMSAPVNEYSHYIASYRLNGDFIYANAIAAESKGNSIARRISMDGDEAIIKGTFYGNIDFDPGPDTAVLKGIGSGNNFFARYSASGKLVFVKNINAINISAASVTIEDIATDAGHNIYTTGNFTGTIDFDPGPGSALLSTDPNSKSYSDIFLAKYDSLGRYLFAYSFGATDTVLNRSQYGNNLEVNDSGEILLSGISTGNTDFDPGADTFLLNPTYYGIGYFMVQYQQPFTCIAPDTLYANAVKTTTARLNWSYPVITDGFEISYKPKTDTVWLVAKARGNERFKRISNLLPNTKYQWRLRTICNTDTTAYSVTDAFTTDADALQLQSVTASALTSQQLGLKLVPNPVTTNYLQLQLTQKATGLQNISIQIFDAKGTKLLHMQTKTSSAYTIIPIELPASMLDGTYFIKLISGNETVQISFIKQSR